jgi:hypothetical protein
MQSISQQVRQIRPSQQRGRWRLVSTHTGDRYKWSAQVQVINLTNEDDLYNFLSTFSGVHYVTPRSISGQIGFRF